MYNTFLHRRHLTLRPHHLICLVGFKGLGYSAAFSANLARIWELIVNDEVLIEIKSQPDEICKPCPRLKNCGSSKQDRSKGSGKGMQIGDTGKRLETGPTVFFRDEFVLEKLELEEGGYYGIQNIYDRVLSRLHRNDIAVLCAGCEWQPFEVCEQSFKDLRKGKHAFNKLLIKSSK